MEQKEVLGWHGTTYFNKLNILENGFKYKKYIVGEPDQRVPNDLGNGVYFFIPFHTTDCKRLSLAYATKYKSTLAKTQGSRITTFKARIKLNEEKFLDLDDIENQTYLEKFKKVIEKELEEELIIIKDGNAKERASQYTDDLGVVIELLQEKIKKENNIHDEPFEAVIKKTYTALKGFPKHNGKNGRELCVRKVELIKVEEE